MLLDVATVPRLPDGLTPENQTPET